MYLDQNSKDQSGLQSDGLHRYSNPSKVSMVFRHFPATFSVLSPYILLIIPPALIFGNSGVWFLIWVSLLAIGGTLSAELLGSRRSKQSLPTINSSRYGRGLYVLSLFAIVVSSLIAIGAAIGGKGSVAVQIGLAESNTGIFGVLNSATGGWTVIGIGLLFASYIGGQCSRKLFLGTAVIPLAAQAVVSYFTQITAPLISQAIFILMMMLLCGLIKLRTVIVAILLALVIWPAIFEFRNEMRQDDGILVSQSIDAFDRIRFDLQFSSAQDLPVPLEIELPTHLQHPSIADVLRFGLIPRFLDPDRQIVSTGNVINVALGGSETSAFTFGPVTTAYVLEGPIYTFAFYFLLAVLMNVIWKGGAKITPVRLVLMSLIIQGPLGWFATFPDASIAALQSLVSGIPILFILLFLRKKLPTVQKIHDIE